MDLAFITETLALRLNIYQIYGLLFLLGSLTVSSISDLKNMAAQKEFLQIWLAFTGIMFVLDFSPGIFSLDFSGGNILKWGLILGLCIISYSDQGFIFNLSKMDAAAIAAVLSLFNIPLIIVFFPLLKLISLFEKPLIKSGNKYPFLPVILTGVSIILALNIYFM